ncbi:hypothetical protein REB14_09065 [Chryseobacterium sp. ES2]|uniref:Magnesium citrate secondary transporter n=1 Tax=Chryseobacterium metallicongregator TaxID=3073042 RepID=A0ABU1E3I1_9FLAO|nr:MULTISPECIES: hypothetical protein [Chryseobacterium]MDR4952320.1 hypothetical protein [Chryseobacterium sp. ES2]
MKKRISFWFLLGMIVWGLIILLRRNEIIIPIINNHFTDCITIPMYCYLIEYIMNGILGYQWKPDLKFVLTSVLYISFLFEVICPKLSNHFTADFFDVLAYFAGGMMYYFLSHRHSLVK